MPPQWAATEAARRGARGPNKELLSQQFAKRNRAMGKRQPVKESTKFMKKGKTLTLCSNLELVVADDVVVDEDVDE